MQSAGIVDADLRRLYEAIYSAFRRRRSLLLLNLQSQVKLRELPWIRALDGQRTKGDDERRQARQALKELVVLAVTSFPHQILPNKLLQEVRALAERAELGLPIVAELAADIFMGALAPTYLHAAHKAAELLEGTLYERYYGLPYARVRAIDDLKTSWFGTPTSAQLGQLCLELAGETGRERNWSVARNGKIIEQVQIVTTHNLAVLFDALALAETWGPRLEEMAVDCFSWICRCLQRKRAAWKTQLRSVKNAAYAWRQMIFFLTMAPEGTIDSFLRRGNGRLREQNAEFQDRFNPDMEGLTRASRDSSAGRPLASEQRGDAIRFLGWTTEKHWLLFGMDK